MAVKSSQLRFKGGEYPAISGPVVSSTVQFDSLNYFSYVSIFSVFIMALFYLYDRKTSLFAILLLYLINIVYSIVLSKDIFNSPKANGSSFITIIIAFALFSNVCSSTLIMDTLRRLHAKYFKHKETIKLSTTNRNRLSLYISMWVASWFILFILTAFFFIESVNTPYFSYEFIGKEISPPGMLLGFLIKVIGSMALTILTLIMIYITFIIRKADAKTLQ